MEFYNTDKYSFGFVAMGRGLFGDKLIYLPHSSSLVKDDTIFYHTLNKANETLIEGGFLYKTPFIKNDEDIRIVFGRIESIDISINLLNFINISNENIPLEEKVIRVLKETFFNSDLVWKVSYEKFYTIKIHGEVIFPRYFKYLYKLVYDLFSDIENKEVVFESEDYDMLKKALYLLDHLHEYIPERTRLRQFGLGKDYDYKFEPIHSILGVYKYYIEGKEYFYRLGEFSEYIPNTEENMLITKDNKLINSIGKFLQIFVDISPDLIETVKMGKIEDNIITSGLLSIFSRNRPRRKDITIFNKPRLDGIIHYNHPFFFPYNPFRWLPNDDQETDYYYLILTIGRYENIDIQVVINPKDSLSIEYLFFNNGYYPSFYDGIFFVNKLFNTKDNFREKYTEIKKLSPIYEKIKEFILDFDVEYLIKRIHEIRTETNLENIYYFDLNLQNDYLAISTDPYYGNVKYYKLGEAVNNKMISKDEEDNIIADNYNLLEDKKFIKNIINKGKVI